jgi:hypothetical protein
VVRSFRCRFWGWSKEKILEVLVTENMVGFSKALYSINFLSTSLQLQLRCKRCTGIWTLQHLQYRVRLNCKVAFPTEVLPYFIGRVCFHTEMRTHVSIGDLALIVRGVKCAVRCKNWPTLPGSLIRFHGGFPQVRPSVFLHKPPGPPGKVAHYLSSETRIAEPQCRY